MPDFDNSTSYTQKDKDSMYLHLTPLPILALIAGILILVIPKAFHYIAAFFLIIVGLIGLFGLNHLIPH